MKGRQPNFEEERNWNNGTSRSEVSDLMMLMKAQLLAAEKREERLEKMLKTAVSATAAQPSAALMKSKQISAERPVLLSTASLAEFSAWEESWCNYLIVTITCEYKILRFLDSDDFAGIKFCDFTQPKVKAQL